MKTTKKKVRLRKKVEVGYTKDGELDEIVLTVNGKCIMHLERMDDNYVWMGIYADKNLHVRLGAKGKINGVVEDE